MFRKISVILSCLQPKVKGCCLWSSNTEVLRWLYNTTNVENMHLHRDSLTPWPLKQTWTFNNYLNPPESIHPMQPQQLFQAPKA